MRPWVQLVHGPRGRPCSVLDGSEHVFQVQFMHMLSKFQVPKVLSHDLRALQHGRKQE